MLTDKAPMRDVLAFVMVPAWSGDARFDLREAMAKGADGALVDPVITHQIFNPDSDPIINRTPDEFRKRCSEPCISYICAVLS